MNTLLEKVQALGTGDLWWLPIAAGLALMIMVIILMHTARRRRAEHQKEWDRAEKRRILVRQENDLRKVQRRDWLLEHPQTLYCATVDGITAVMTPGMYRVAQAETEKAKLNEEWTSNTTLVPAPVFLFVTTSGREVFEKNSHWKAQSMEIAALFSDLHSLIREFGLTLESRRDIFVPFANESLAPFEEHRSCILRAKGAPWALAESQAPRELWPMRTYPSGMPTPSAPPTVKTNGQESLDQALAA